MVPAAPPAGPGVPIGSPEETKARLKLTPERGFYDDAWALDPLGQRLALIRTDRDDFQRVEIFDLESQKAAPVSTIELPPPARVFEGLSFLPGASGLLLVSAGPADTQVVEAIDATGRSLGKTGPVAGFGSVTRGGEPLLVTLERRTGRAGELTYVVATLKLPSLKSAGKPHSYLVGTDGALRTPPVVPVAFFDGYSKLLAQRPGWYDRKKDARQPDAQSVVDLLSGKPVFEGPIEDVYGWARTTRLRREHPNRTAFVQMADVVAGQSGVELCDPTGRLIRLPLAVPFRLYDRFTLKDQEGPDPGLITFGIQVDPVNVDAVARKKADLPYLDVYSTEIAHPEANRLRARVPLDARPVVWSTAANRLVVLRRYRSFARGGDGVDVYDLSP